MYVITCSVHVSGVKQSVCPPVILLTCQFVSIFVKYIIQSIGQMTIISALYFGLFFFGDESRVCCGCRAGSPFRLSLFNFQSIGQKTIISALYFGL